MNTNSRQIVESPFHIGEEDGHPLPPLTIPASWISGPTAPALFVYDAGGTDVTATTTVGVPTIAGQVVTWPKFTGRLYRFRNNLDTPDVTATKGITKGQEYQLVLRFQDSAGPLSCLAKLVGQK